MHKFLFLFFFIFSSLLSGQDEIFLYNPSFEDKPRLSKTPKGWYDCNAPGNSPVDTHPVPYGEFEVNAIAAHGHTYVGMVVRENNAVEAIGQRLVEPLKKGRTYVFEMFVARSPRYLSGSFSSNTKVNYNAPCKLRILGGDKYCESKELLAESELIVKEQWVNQQFIFRPKEDYKYILFEAFYKNAEVFAYNGNLLIDGATTITEIREDGSFFADNLYQHYLPEDDLYPDAEPTDNIYEEFDTSSPTAGLIPNFSEEDKEFYSKQMSYVIFRRGMTALENDAHAALSKVGERLAKNSQEQKLRIRFKEENKLLYNLRLNTIRETLLEAGLSDTRFSFGEKPESKVIFSGASRDVEMMIY